jgi:hypothetical protein
MLLPSKPDRHFFQFHSGMKNRDLVQSLLEYSVLGVHWEVWGTICWKGKDKQFLFKWGAAESVIVESVRQYMKLHHTVETNIQAMLSF